MWVQTSAVHSQKVLGDGLVQKVFWRYHPTSTAGYLFVGGDAQYSAEVIGV